MNYCLLVGQLLRLLAPLIQLIHFAFAAVVLGCSEYKSMNFHSRIHFQLSWIVNQSHIKLGLRGFCLMYSMRRAGRRAVKYIDARHQSLATRLNSSCHGQRKYFRIKVQKCIIESPVEAHESSFVFDTIEECRHSQSVAESPIRKMRRG